MSPEERGNLESLLAAADEVIAEYSAAGEDPVAVRRLSGAWLRRGVVLSSLGRPAEALESLDTFLRGAEGPPVTAPPATQRRFAIALEHKAGVLLALGREEEAGLLCDEIRARFDSATDGRLNATVLEAIGLRIVLHLRAGEERAAAELATEMARPLAWIEDDRIERPAELVLHAVGMLGSVGFGPLPGPIGGITEAVAGAVMDAGARAGQAAGRLSGAAKRSPAGLWERAARSAGRLPVPGPVGAAVATLGRHRDRHGAAIALAEALAERLGRPSDPRLAALEARARLLIAQARLRRGDLRAVLAVAEMVDRSDPGAVGAFTRLAEEVAPTGALGQLHAVSMLFARARSLIGDDPALARLAFDDSLERRFGDRTPPVVRLAVAFYRWGLREGR